MIPDDHVSCKLPDDPGGDRLKTHALPDARLEVRQGIQGLGGNWLRLVSNDPFNFFPERCLLVRIPRQLVQEETHAVRRLDGNRILYSFQNWAAALETVNSRALETAPIWTFLVCEMTRSEH